MTELLEPEANATRGGDVELSSVPQAARKAAEKAVPGGKWQAAFIQTIFELEGTDAKGRAVVVDVTDDGEIGEISTEIPLKEVPAVVMTALKAKMPRFTVESATESRQEGKVVGYSLEGKRPRDKEEIAVFVSPDGKTVEIDEGA